MLEKSFVLVSLPKLKVWAGIGIKTLIDISLYIGNT